MNKNYSCSYLFKTWKSKIGIHELDWLVRPRNLLIKNMEYPLLWVRVGPGKIPEIPSIQSHDSVDITVFVLFFCYGKDCLPLGKPARFFHSSDSSSLKITAYTCSWPEGGEKTKYFEVVGKKALMSIFRSHAPKT